VRPAVILQDPVLPDSDGPQPVTFVRANPAARDTPTTVLPGKEGPAVEAQAFPPGANDCPAKLPGPIDLVARARCHSRAYLSRPERDGAYRRLAEGRRLPAEETAQAARHVQPLLPERLKGR
jgi:sigma-B regulation protein RsbU (phosphoserine phosphatase)